MNHLYCTDTDLHRWEPALAAEAVAAAQTVFHATATLQGKSLTLAPDDADRLLVGHIVVVTRGVSANAVYRVAEPANPGSNTFRLTRFRSPFDARGNHDITEPRDVSIAVRTFVAQRLIVSRMLHWMSGEADGGAGDLVGVEGLRKPCALGALHLIYAGLHASARRNDADLIVRTELYARLYRKALKDAAVETGRDGLADHRRSLRPVECDVHF